MPVTRGRFTSFLGEKKVLWAPLYQATLEILGATGTILPMGDSDHEPSNQTTVTTIGAEQVVFTYQGSGVDAFDTPPWFLGPSGIPIIGFNGTDEEADSPDIAYFTRADAPFSMAAWVNLTDATSSVMLSKYDAAGNTREWVYWFNGDDKLEFDVYDEDDAENDHISVIAASAQAESTWVHVVGTCDGSTDEAGLNLYINGAVDGSQVQADSGNFGQSRDTASTVKLAHLDATPGSLFDGLMAGGPLGISFTQAELTADQALRLYQLGRSPLGV